MSSGELISIKELASKLKVTDALLKKLIKDFDIGTERVEKRIYLSEASVTTVRDVLALRASGKKNKEIKELFEESKAAQASPETAVVETKETAIETVKPKAEAKKAKPAPKKAKPTPKKVNEPEIADESEESRPEAAAQAEAIATAPIPDEVVAAVAKEYEDSEEHSVDISSYLEEDQHAEDEPSMAMRLAEETGIHHEDTESSEDHSLILEDDHHEDEAPAIQEPERATERTADRLNPRKMRRRQFSFSYIQRQIANDSKRIQYLQQKIKRGSLSTREEMNLKDSLEHRSKLLSGWVHMLRWVKS